MALNRPLVRDQAYRHQGVFVATVRSPAAPKKRLALTSNGNICYQLKTLYRDGTAII